MCERVEKPSLSLPAAGVCARDRGGRCGTARRLERWSCLLTQDDSLGPAVVAWRQGAATLLAGRVLKQPSHKPSDDLGEEPSPPTTP